MNISVITAVFNRADHIESCLQSLSSQTYPDIEHIIIDGGSTDGTLDIIKEFASKQSEVSSQKSKDSLRFAPHDSRVSSKESDSLNNTSRFTLHTLRVISEKDNGIYDALNKGIRLATGDVIGFLHADDIYADKTAIEKVVKVMSQENCDSCYGDLEYVREAGPRFQVPGDREYVSRAISRQSGVSSQESADTNYESRITLHASRFTVVRYWKSGPFSIYLLRKGWMPPHPTFFVRREVYEKYGLFDTSFRISADYELMLRFLDRHRISTCYIPEVLIMMRMGGASNRSLQNILRKSAEDLRAMKMHDIGGLPTLLRKNLSKIPQFFKRQ